VPTDLFEQARKRTQEIGSREEAIRRLALVPPENRHIALKAINEVFPPPEQAPPPETLHVGFGEAGSQEIPTSEMARTVQGMSLPILAGAAALPFSGAPGVVSGMSMAGEALSQGLGASEPSPANLALSGGLPLLSRGAGGIASAGATFVPAGKAAQQLNIIGQQAASRTFQGMRSADDAGLLFAQAKRMGVDIPVQKALAPIKDSLAKLQGLSKGARSEFSRAISVLDGLADDIEKSGGKFPLEKFQLEMEALGEIFRDMRKTGGSGFKHVSGARAALLGALDDAKKVSGATGAGANILDVARKTFLRNETVNEMDDLIGAAFKVRRGLGDAAQFNPTEVIQGLKKSPFFSSAFSKDEQKEIYGLLTKINRIPVLSAPRGSNPGSGAFLARQLARAGGAYAGAQISPLAAAGGLVAPDVVRVGKDVALALQFPEGRKVLGRLLTATDGALTPKAAEILGTFLAAHPSVRESVREEFE